MATSSGERVVVLTGANEGIGYHMVTALSDAGYRVAALDIEVDAIRAIRDQSPDQIVVQDCDVSNTDEVDNAVTTVLEQWGRIDILVNNAAVARFARFDAQTTADTQREFAVNVFGYLRMIRAVLPHMRDRGDGIIHNMGSGTGDVGHPGLTGYAATKGAIKALTRSLQLEFRQTGISCTLMVPPTTDTKMSADLGYPEWMRAPPEDVGRKLAAHIESTSPVITPDWQTSFGLFLITRFPRVWRILTERYVALPE